MALAQWVVFTAVHTNHALSFTLFVNTLDKLVKPLQSGSYFCDHELKLFWEGAKKLLPSCINLVRKLRKKATNEKTTIKQLVEVLKIIKVLDSLELPSNLDLFPDKSYAWITDREEGQNLNINTVLKEAVAHGANDWFNYIVENNTTKDESDDGKLQLLIKIVQLVRTDLQKAIEIYDNVFKEYAYYNSALSAFINTFLF